MKGSSPFTLWRILPAVLLCLGIGPAPPRVSAQSCEMPPQVSRREILQAMSAHGPYSLTSTTTSMLFGSRALLELVRQRRRQVPGETHFFIDHADWFSAHLATAGVSYAEMSESARAAYEHKQDILVNYGPQVVEEVLEGPTPITSLDVMIFWPDSNGAPREFSYHDTLSVPKMDAFNQRVIRFRVLEYDSMLVFDEVTGISVRPVGFLSALFAVLGKPDLKETRIAVSKDYWQVMRGRVKIFPGISKTGVASIEPSGVGHEKIPRDRPDLRALAQRLRQPLELRYGPPSCQAELLMRGRDSGDCPQLAMGGVGSCAGTR